MFTSTGGHGIQPHQSTAQQQACQRLPRVGKDNVCEQKHPKSCEGRRTVELGREVGGGPQQALVGGLLVGVAPLGKQRVGHVLRVEEVARGRREALGRRAGA